MRPYEIVVVGASMGGLDAIGTLLRPLPREFPLPVAVVQHRAPDAEGMLAELQLRTALPVVEVEDKDRIVPGRVYVAPPDYHLLVDDGWFALSTDERVCSARPSVDMLFSSAADAYGQRVLGVVLTGASRDGARGVERIKQRGGTVVAQAPETAESPVMPTAAIATGAVDRVLPLTDLSRFVQVAAQPLR